MKLISEEKIVKFGTKIGTNKYLLALRDGFAYTMPITIIGSFLALLLNLPIPGYAEFMTNIFGENWTYLFNLVYGFTIPFLSIYALVGITYAYCKQNDLEPIIYIIISLLSFLIVTPILTLETGEVIGGAVNIEFFGPKGMFMSIIFGLLIPMSLHYLSNVKRLKISMPDQVPSAVVASFNKLIPVAIIAIAVGLFNTIFVSVLGTDLFSFIYEAFQTPIKEIVGQSYLGGVFSLFFTNAAWFFGLHGGLLMSPINQVVFGELLPANIDAYVNGIEIPYLFTGVPFFEVFSKMGGGGCGLALIVALKISSKNPAARKIASIGLVPSMFNIVEPLVFGLPIVFNPIMAIPFVLVPIVTYTLAYIALQVGLIAPFVVQVPWTVPIGINAFLSTGGDFMSVIMQLLIFCVGVLVYIPFIKIWDKSQNFEQTEIKTDKKVEVE